MSGRLEHFNLSDLSGGDLGTSVAANQDTPLEEFDDILVLVNKVLERRYAWLRPTWAAMSLVLASVMIYSLVLACFYSHVGVYEQGYYSSDGWYGCFVFSDHSYDSESPAYSRSNFVDSMAAQCAIMAVLVLVAMASSAAPMAMLRLDMAPTCIVGCSIGLLQGLALYDFSAVYIVPLELAASFVSLRGYVVPSMYDKVEDNHAKDPDRSNVDCSPAYRLNEATLDMQLVAMVLITTIVGLLFFVEAQRRRLVRKVLRLRTQRGYADLHHIRGRFWIATAARVGFLSYIISVALKIDIQLRSQEDLQTVVEVTIGRNTTMPVEDAYPYPAAAFDPSAIFMIVSLLSVTFALSHRSFFGLRFAAVMGLASLLTFWPNWFGTEEAFRRYEFDTDDICYAFFSGPSYGSPSRSTALSYCHENWACFLAATLWLAAMQTFVGLCVWTNVYSEIPKPTHATIRTGYMEIDEVNVPLDFDASLAELILRQPERGRQPSFLSGFLDEADGPDENDNERGERRSVWADVGRMLSQLQPSGGGRPSASASLAYEDAAAEDVEEPLLTEDHEHKSSGW